MTSYFTTTGSTLGHRGSIAGSRQVTQLGSIQMRGVTAYLKQPVLKEQRRGDAVRCNKSSRKGQVSLTHTQETHPGRSVLLLLECTVKTFSFIWSQWYSTPEFKALATSKKENILA